MYVKIPAWRKLTFGLMDTANNFSWSLVSSYLTIFYTDIFLIPTATVSLLFLLARFWDALNDPLVGTMADRTNTKLGRFRPWVLFSCIPLVIMTVITFTAHPEWSNTSKTIYIFVTYGILVLVYTMVNIPYSAMTSAITQDPQERGSLASWRLTCAVGGGLLVAQVIARLLPQLTEATGSAAKGYQLSALILGVFAIILYLLGVFTHKEVVTPTADQLEKQKMPFLQMVKHGMKNKSCIIAVLAHFAYGAVSYGRAGAYAYYFTYVLGNPVLLGSWIFFNSLPMLAGTFTAQFVANKLRSKGAVLKISGIGYGLILVLQHYLVPKFGFTFLCITTIPAGFLSGWFASMSYAIIPDLTEVGELESGIRMDGFYSSFTSFMNKLGMAIGTAGVVAIIGALGYVPNAVQTPAVNNAISMFMYILPGILTALIGVLFFAYDLDYDRFEQILAELQAKKKQD